MPLALPGLMGPMVPMVPMALTVPPALTDLPVIRVVLPVLQGQMVQPAQLAQLDLPVIRVARQAPPGQMDQPALTVLPGRMGLPVLMDRRGRKIRS